LNNFIKNIFKIKNKNVREIGASSWYCWKALDEWDFFGGNLVNFRPKAGEILNFGVFNHLIH
jgi:hypothetical protein